MKIKTLTAMAAVACCLATTSQATLVVLGPNSGAPLVPPSTAIVGATLVTSWSQAFTAGTFSGTLLAKVWSGDGNNTLGGYTFEYIVSNSGVDAINRFTVNGWAGAGLVRVDNTGAGSAATDADRSQGLGGDRTVGFDWSGIAHNIPAGGSADLIIQSSLSHWAFTTASASDGSSVDGIKTLAVPEPTTMIAGGLLLLPFAASTLRFVRKRRTA